MSRFIPTFNEPFLDGRGCITPIWRDYLRSIPADAALAVIEQQIAALNARVAALEGEGGQTFNVLGQNSVQTFGDLATGNVYAQLQGDEPAPAADHYYGTDAAGARGFHALLLAALADVSATAPTVGQVLAYNGSEWTPTEAPSGGVLPLVTGEILNDQPVLMCGTDGSLIYAPVN